ncbi:Alpha-mannosidase I mns4 [Trifolium repens]|nr:Alpha-mannosidase I mns4 [Trifolium repens]
MYFKFETWTWIYASRYVEVNMDFAALVWPLFNSLQAFWPGLQALAGDINPAIRTDAAFLSVWRRYGFTFTYYFLTYNL